MIEEKYKPGGNLMAPIVMKTLRAVAVVISSSLLAACAQPSVGGEEMGLIFNEIECDMTRRDLFVIARASDVRFLCDATAPDGHCQFRQDSFTHVVGVEFGENGQILKKRQVKDEFLFPEDVDYRSCSE